MDSHHPHNFPIDREYIDRMAIDSEVQLQKLMKTPRPFIFRIGEAWTAMFMYGTPKWNLLPHKIGFLAKEIGFQPVSKSLLWILPTIVVRVSYWIGPEGFVSLSGVKGIYGIDAMMSDGRSIGILNRRDEILGPRTRLISSGDLKKDYDRILEVVHQHTLETGAKPIFVTNPKTLKMLHYTFVHLHRTTLAMLWMMLGQLMVFGMIAAWVYLMVTN
jgi:hypothetical protein